LGASIALSPGAAASLRRLAKPVTIGVIADLHHDLMHDGEARLDAFLKEMAETEPDAIMQLGDFAYPKKENEPVIDRFNQAHEISLHVIGNHDTDQGHTREECLDIWGMSGRYYSQDIGGLRVLVLDGNDKGSPAYRGGYASFIGKAQVEWLEEELESHAGSVVGLCHQPLAGSGAVDNAEEIQGLLGRYAEKVVLTVNGHTHIDEFLRVAKVPYLHVNSASYKWVGGSHQHESYSKEIHAEYPWISRTCPYRDSLFTTLTFDGRTGTVSVKGKESSWVGKSPAELGIDSKPGKMNGEEVVPRIRSRRIEGAGA